MQRISHNYLRFLILCLCWGALFSFWSCRTTRFVPDDELLLAKVRVHSTSRDLSLTELKSYLRQRENLKVLGFWKVHLGIYNLAGADTSKWINKLLHRVGEEPVLYDDVLTRMSRDQLQRFMQSKGYLLAQVSDTAISVGKKKVKVVYDIQASKVYSINQIGYRVEDDSLRPFVLSDTLRSFIRRGRPFDSDVHEEERERITSRIRNRGYYGFSKDYIFFAVDSALGNYSVNDTLVLKAPAQDIDKAVLAGHKKYKYRNVYYIISDNPQKALVEEEGRLAGFDTLDYEGSKFLFVKEIDVHPTVLVNSSYIIPGQLYGANLVERTQVLLSGLTCFRYIDIRIKDVSDHDASSEFGLLDCYIQLFPAKKQMFTFELEGTNSSGNLGAGGNLRYQHRNLWGGAELLDVGLKMSTERQFVRNTADKFNTSEYGVEVGVEYPKFWIPFDIEGFRRRFNPKTAIKVAYNYQHRPDYTRTIANVRYGYIWRSSRFKTHTLNPAEFNLVWLPYINSDFWDYIRNTFLRYSYEDHFVLNSSYSYLFNNQSRTRQIDYWYARFNVEGAGNLLRSVIPLWETPDSLGIYQVLGIQFAQYVKGDVDLRYHYSVNRVNSFAFRLFTGVGYPYGNSMVMPFEKRYFSGGANGIRAWPVRGLGPGTYVDTVSTFYNQTADIKLEMNAEYRFKLFWVMEGALFADAGNIWSIRSDASPEGGLFKFDQFYKQIALGVGLGLRLDFDYFLFRLDAGIKARDPVRPAGDRWVLTNKPLLWDDLSFNFAIGYPF